MTTDSRCPRPGCGGPLMADLDGASCFNCGYVEYHEIAPHACLATMSQPPGLTPEGPLERYEDGQARRGNRSPTSWQRRKDRQRLEDEALGEAVARRLGLTLEDLQSNAQDALSRNQRREAIVELRSLGLSYFRIGNQLARSEAVIRAVLVREKRAQG